MFLKFICNKRFLHNSSVFLTLIQCYGVYNGLLQKYTLTNHNLGIAGFPELLCIFGIQV